MGKEWNILLRSIHQTASDLEEAFGDDLANGVIPEALSIRRILTWEKNVSSFGRPALHKRLKWLKADRERILKAKAQHESESKNLLGWIERLKAILVFCEEWDESQIASHPLLSNNKPIPFQELLISWVDYAVSTINGENALFSKEAKTQLARSLLKGLSKLSAACFQCEFEAFKADEKSPEVGSYNRFIGQMLGAGRWAFWEKYAALARLLVAAVDRWVLGTQNLFQRLEKDYSAICLGLFEQHSVGAVLKIQSDLSAAHSNEGQVQILHFARGRRIVYKPRSGAQDIAWERILNWINDAGEILNHQAAKVLDRANYFWQAFVTHSSCETIAEVGEYYQRVGHLAALMHCLGSTDYHFGNFHANGPFPILTDNETIVSARIKVSDRFSITSDRFLDEGIAHSLSQGHFLMDSARFFYPRSPSIAGVFENVERYSKIFYSPVNQDKMRMRSRKLIRIGSNFAKLKGQRSDPKQFLREIGSGFHEMTSFLTERRDELYQLVQQSTSGFTMQMRLLIRPSAFYNKLLIDSLSPELCRNGIDRDLYFEKCAAFYLETHAENEGRRLLQMEKEMAAQNLVPWFHLKMDQKQVFEEKEHAKSPTIMLSSAKEVFEHRLNQLAKAPAFELNKHTLAHYFGPQKANKAEGCGLEQMVRNLFFCYSHLYNPNEERLRSGLSDKPSLKAYFLDEGVSGPILIFAAWYKLKNEKPYRELINQLLSPIKQLIERQSSSNSPKELPIGGLRGIGSIVNTLCTVSKLVKDEAPLELARSLITMVVDRFDDDLSFGTGLCGLLHAITKWSNATGDRSFDDFLVRGLTYTFDRVKAASVSGQGFADGMPGILFTCCKLMQHLETAHLQPQLEDLHRRVRDELQQGWEHKPLSFENGLAGWLLADDAASASNLKTMLPMQLSTAVRQLSKLEADETDYIAYGVAGRMEAMLLLRTQFPNELSSMIHRMRTDFAARGKFRLAPRYLNPFFYRGISGIIYQQLRYDYPAELPSIWDIK